MIYDKNAPNVAKHAIKKGLSARSFCSLPQMPQSMGMFVSYWLSPTVGDMLSRLFDTFCAKQSQRNAVILPCSVI